MSIYLRIHGTGSVCFCYCKVSPTFLKFFASCKCFNMQQMMKGENSWEMFSEHKVGENQQMQNHVVK